MTRETVADFVRQLKSILSELPPVTTLQQADYLDLGNLDNPRSLAQKLSSEELPYNPLAEALDIILLKVHFCQVDKVKLGINELLKSYLQKVNDQEEKIVTHLYLSQLDLVFRRCLAGDFPYDQEIWDYLGSCLNTTGLHLISLGFETATRQLLEVFFHLGKLAAQKGLQTSTTQGHLRVLEAGAVSQGYPDLAASAKNFRFNLELY